MRTISWVLLTIIGLLLLVGSLVSLQLAYSGGEDQIGPVSLSELTQGRPEVSSALRGRRATAAAFAAGFAALFLTVVLVPYRRGEVWSWWALLIPTLFIALLSFARVSFLETSAGSGTAGTLLLAVAVALLFDLKRLSRSPEKT